MPRGRSPENIELQIQTSLARIARYTDLIETEKTKLQKLQSQKRDADMSQLYTFMDQSGLSADEVLQILRENQSS